MRKMITEDDIPESEFAAKESELFHDSVIGDGFMEAWYRYQLSDLELIERFRYFRQQAAQHAATAVVDARNQDAADHWEARS